MSGEPAADPRRATSLASDRGLRPTRAATVVAAVVYLVLALWTYAVVLPSPATLLPVNDVKPAIAQLARYDESIAVASIARNAHVALTDPLHFLDGFQCHPLPHSYTLGEHMFGSGLLAAVPYLLTRDPVLSYNAVLILGAWIAGLTMFFLAREFVGDAGAAFVAGLLFALEPSRIIELAHPFASADLWTPAALLFLHRLFARGGVWNALAFGLFGGLEVVQSLYPLLWTTVLLLCLSVQLAIVHRRQLLARVPYLALSLTLLAAVAWLVLGPYLETRATWGLLGGRGSLGTDLREYFRWSALLLLAAVGVLDRLRGPRRVLGCDPRPAFVIAALLLLWSAALPIDLGIGDLKLPSLRLLLQSLIPGLDAVRGLYSLVQGSDLALAFLAAYGVRAVIERLPRAAAVVLVVALSVWIVRTQSVVMKAWAAPPAAEDVALLDRSPGTTLDLPFAPPGSLKGMANADYLLLASYSPRRSSACYASFPSPLDLSPLANKLPDPGAADALAALGFHTVALHVQDYWRPDLRRFLAQLEASPESQQRLHLIGRTDRLAVYTLVGRTPVQATLEALSAADPGTTLELSGPRAQLSLDIVNHTRSVFRHPDPIAPTPLEVRWRDGSGALAGGETVRALLPLALAPGDGQPVTVDVAVPSTPGAYTVTLAPAAAPRLVLARATVQVGSQR
jgi:hypothetical protein